MTLHHLLPSSVVESGAPAGKEDARLIQAKASLGIVLSDKALQLPNVQGSTASPRGCC